ncbi:MAG: BspA family leucine-rich repeat surface protein [Mollicutes bacterium]|nr:BspA family leucine-rich repeat surface protein [Mollicutes bacterium]
MGTTAQKLNKILETKEAIRTAINNKGGTLTTTDTFASYPSAIDSLPSGGGNTLKTLLDATKSCYYLFYNYKGISVNDLISYSDTSSVKNMSSMFYYCDNLTAIPQLDTSSVTNMSYIFYQCANLTTIPQLDTSSVTTMSNMFYFCTSLKTIPQLDTSKVVNMNHMFYYCTSLKTIPQLDTRKVKDFGVMFQDCRELTTIDITHMNISSPSYSVSFAYNCFSLTKLIIRNMNIIPSIYSDSFSNCYHFTGTTDSTYNPQGLKDGRIYVPDDKVDALKTATNWSVYADIIVPLSTLVE